MSQKNLATRLTVLGSGGAGKTALTVQYIHSHFVCYYDATIEDTYRRQVEVDGVVTIADILDTAGQDEYTALRSSWFIGSDGFLLVYNMCSRNSFEEAKIFLEQISRTNEGITTPFVVVATHADMADKRTVSKEEGLEFAKECGQFSSYLEVSNKDRINVDESFAEAIRLVRRVQQRNDPNANENGQKKSKKLFKLPKNAQCTIL